MGTLAIPEGAAPHTFACGPDAFLLDGKPFQIVSGEMHYARIPREYWRDRLRMARAMGLNTVATYVFWNVHEPKPEVFEFSGNADVAAFVRLAREEGLFVILRPGPYACAEWDFGGFPSWLLADRSLVVRGTDERFLAASARYLARLGKEVAPLQVTRGGPILLVQVENEYGSFGSDKVYMGRIRDQLMSAGFEVPLFTADGPSQMAAGSLPDVLPAVNGASGRDVFETIRKFRPSGPFFVAEFYPGWLDHWGEPHAKFDAKHSAVPIDELLSMGASVNLYMFHGGTNFGFTNGANFGGRYQPQPTSYDYDAPLDEAGRPTSKYAALRAMIAKHLPAGHAIPEVPVTAPVIEIPRVELRESLAVLDSLGAAARSSRPLCMEEVGQSSGYVLYRTTIDRPASGTLVFEELRDYAVVLLDGKRVASLDRRHRQSAVPLEVARAPAVLDILVENGGRINFGPRMVDDRKGITEKVVLGDRELLEWQIFSLPVERPAASRFSQRPVSGPAYHRGTFELRKTGDTFLDLRGWGKGAVWMNGRCLGRFWKIGPQQTLYVPGPWLVQGANEIVVLDLEDRGHRSVSGLSEPILDRLEKDDLAPAPRQQSATRPLLRDEDRVKEGRFVAGDSAQEARFTPVSGRYVCLESRSSLAGDPFASAAEIDVLGADGKALPRDGWTVVYVDSEELSAEDGRAENAFDGDPATIWHTEWGAAKPAHPHVLVLDLARATPIGVIRYRPREGDRPGKIADFRLFVRTQPFH